MVLVMHDTILYLGSRICITINETNIDPVHHSKSTHVHGTVRYMGFLPTLQGDWIGIEWDQIDESKISRHSGQWKDIHYFYTRYPKTGSFVPRYQLENLLEKSNCNHLTLSDAFIQKYEGINPSIISLPHIKTIDGLSQPLFALFSETSELDLSYSFLGDLSVLFALLLTMPKLTRLSLSHNRFDILDITSSSFVALQKITFLDISDTLMTWNEIIFLCQKIFPNLLELGCSSNRLEDNGDLLNVSSSIKDLYFEHNNVTTLQFVTKFPALKSLNVSYNPLGNQLLSHSPNGLLLETLVVSSDNDQVSKWASWIEDIRTGFPGLRKLSCRAFKKDDGVCPLMLYIVSNIPELNVVNGSILTNSWRRSLEKNYVQYARDHEEYQGWKYFELSSIYSELTIKEFHEPIVSLNSNPSDDCLFFNIKLVVSESSYSLPSLVKSMTIIQLKRLIHNIYSIPWRKMTKMSIKANETEAIQLKCLLKSLSEYTGKESSFTLVIH